MIKDVLNRTRRCIYCGWVIRWTMRSRHELVEAIVSWGNMRRQRPVSGITPIATPASNNNNLTACTTYTKQPQQSPAARINDGNPLVAMSIKLPIAPRPIAASAKPPFRARSSHKSNSRSAISSSNDSSCVRASAACSCTRGAGAANSATRLSTQPRPANTRADAGETTAMLAISAATACCTSLQPLTSMAARRWVRRGRARRAYSWACL